MRTYAAMLFNISGYTGGCRPSAFHRYARRRSILLRALNGSIIWLQLIFFQSIWEQDTAYAPQSERGHLAWPYSREERKGAALVLAAAHKRSRQQKTAAAAAATLRRRSRQYAPRQIHIAHLPLPYVIRRVGCAEEQTDACVFPMLNKGILSGAALLTAIDFAGW